MAEGHSDEPSRVREGQGFDVAKLEAYLAAHLPKARDGAPVGVTVEQFAKGYSNLTYLVKAFGDELVLRRSPPGVKIKSAHDMGREYKILSHLSRVWPKVPKPLLVCDDESVIGSSFYVMERVRGTILRAKPPAGLVLDEARMRSASESLVDTLAEIHAVDYHAAGLGDLGRPEGYVERQVTGWAERYKKAQTDEVPQVDALGEWLVERMPKPPPE